MTVERVVTGEFCTNTYIIVDGADAVVIDPAAEFDKISKRIDILGATVRCVLITHAHFDHIGAVARFAELGAKVYISRIDHKLLIKNDFNIDLGFSYDRIRPFNADVLLSDNDTFTVGGHNYTVIATPGHTTGSICYLMDNKCIFTGDTLFRLGVGRTDFPFSSYSDIIASLHKLFKLSGDLVVYPGHGESTVLEFERSYNPYADRD